MAQGSANPLTGQLATYRHQALAAPTILDEGTLAPSHVTGVVAQHGFQGRDRLFPPHLTLWTFVVQVLSPDGSCRDALSRIRPWQIAQGQVPCSSNTGSYCKARARLPEGAVASLARQSGVMERSGAGFVPSAHIGALPNQEFHHGRVSFQGGVMEILPNNALAQVSMRNLKDLNDLTYDEQDLKFSTRLQESLPAPSPLDEIQKVIYQSGSQGAGSTDVGDVSWVVPTTGFTTACWVPGTPGHSLRCPQSSSKRTVTS